MIKMQFYFYLFTILIKALLKASPFLWWCFLKCFEIRFNFIPQIIFLYYKDGDTANPATTHSDEHSDYYIVFYIVNLGNYKMFAKEYTRATYYRKIVFQNLNVKWYSYDDNGGSADAETQYNILNRNYYYYAFG